MVRTCDCLSDGNTFTIRSTGLRSAIGVQGAPLPRIPISARRDGNAHGFKIAQLAPPGLRPDPQRSAECRAAENVGAC